MPTTRIKISRSLFDAMCYSKTLLQWVTPKAVHFKMQRARNGSKTRRDVLKTAKHAAYYPSRTLQYNGTLQYNKTLQ